VSSKEFFNKTGHGAITAAYLEKVRHKLLLLGLFICLIALVSVYAIASGSYYIPFKEVLNNLFGCGENTTRVVITSIRMPRVVAALLSGWGLSLSGLTIQSLLKNPLGSPITLGISHGSAFGAAVAIVVFGAGMVAVTASAFAGGMAATLVILALARFKRLSPLAIILTGTALHSLFLSGTYLIQYIANETDLARVVFWSFGDVARSSWMEIWILAGGVLLITVFLALFRWDLNALASGDDTAKGLGVRVEQIRLSGMFTATLVAAMATAFHGIIGFLGLIAPHMARRIVGEDHSILVPFSSVLGALLLLLADTLGRVFIGSGSLPVGVITSFLGAPLFLFLLVREVK
jgi:iron complex transport system permease protein